MDNSPDCIQSFREITTKSINSSQVVSYFSNDLDCLRCIYLNIRSLNKNFDSFLVFLESLKLKWQIIILGETWLDSEKCGVQLEGYKMLKTNTGVNRNDGVVVYVSECVSVREWRELELGGVFGLSLDITYLGKRSDLLTVYRTHDTDLDNFTQALRQYYNHMTKDRTYIFMGDINANLLITNYKTERYLDLLFERGFVCGINEPTRVVGDSKTCIDHIFVNHIGPDSLKTAVIMTDITDHYCVALEIPHKRIHVRTEDKTFTYIDKINMGKLVDNCDWKQVTDINDVNSSCNKFFSLLNEFSETSKRSSKKSHKLKKIKPWITEGLIKSIRTRDKISKTLKHQPFNTELRRYYVDFRNRLNILLRFTKNNYYRSKLNNANNPKIFWSTVNELAGRTTKKDIFPLEQFTSNRNMANDDIQRRVANEFNTYFSQVGFNLASKIDSSGPPVVNDSDYTVNATFTLHTITEDQLQHYVSGLRGGSAPGHDGLSSDFLKQHYHSLSRPLLHIINKSIVSGVVPDAFKVAKVIPIFKANDKTNKSNFRPISLLSVFSKVLERVIKDQLIAYLESNSIITERQFGFRASKNISDALFNINKDINDSLSNNKRCQITFLDLAKAFDTVERNKLLEKLNLIGVKGREHNWFKSYLEKRRQITTINGVDSEVRNIDFGVVQGSTLGPLLFLIYINNLAKVSISGKLYLFADDTAILHEGDSWESVFCAARRDLSKIKSWFDQNLLTLNISKTKFMPIALRDRTDTLTTSIKLHVCGDFDSVDCGCDSIERVNCYKYLGIMMDNRLSWSVHVKSINNKLRKLIFVFSQLSNILTPKEIKVVYCAYAQSIIETGILAWGGGYKTTINPLLITQKAILKAALGRCRRYPTDALFEEIKVLDVRQLFVRSVLCNIYKNSENFFQPVRHSYITRNSVNFGVQIPKLSKTFSVTNSYYISHILYRNLPDSLKNMEVSFSVYKSNINKWLHDIGRESVENLITSIYRR